jgi:hypothetical protein
VRRRGPLEGGVADGITASPSAKSPATGITTARVIRQRKPVARGRCSPSLLKGLGGDADILPCWLSICRPAAIRLSIRLRNAPPRPSRGRTRVFLSHHVRPLRSQPPRLRAFLVRRWTRACCVLLIAASGRY